MASRLGRQRFLRNWMFYPSMAIVILLFASLFIPLVNKWLDDELNALGTIILFPLILVATLTSLATNQLIPWREMTLLHLRQHRILGAFGSTLLLAIGAVAGLLPLLEKKGGTETALKQMSVNLGEIKTMLVGIGSDAKKARLASEETRDRINDWAGTPGEPTQIEQKLNGIWGQEDCANSYDFALDQRGRVPRLLTIASLDNGDGVDPVTWSFVVEAAMPIIGADGFKRSKLRTTEEIGLLPKYKGSKVEFTLTQGAVETLRWESFHTDENGIRDVNPLTLIRCPDAKAKP